MSEPVVGSETRSGSFGGAAESALVDAAIRIFSERSPQLVSVREIAEAAGVDHSLVHHYFDSKQALVRAALDHLVTAATGSLAEGSGLELGSPVATYCRVLGRVILEDPAATGLRDDHPLLSFLKVLLRQVYGVDDDRSARLRASQATALVMGWFLFEPFLLASGGLEDEDPQFLLDDLRQLLIRLAVPIAPPG